MRSKRTIRYEIMTNTEKTPRETTATLDHALIRAAEISLEKNIYGTLFIYLIDEDQKRSIRGYGRNGKSGFVTKCTFCHGTGRESSDDTCYKCNGHGVKPDAIG